MVHHADQLRPRVAVQESETTAGDGAGDAWIIGDGANTEVVQDSAEASVAPSTNPQGDVPTENTDDSREAPAAPVPEDQPESSGGKTARSTTRRSTRVRQPPIRFEEQCFCITFNRLCFLN